MPLINKLYFKFYSFFKKYFPRLFSYLNQRKSIIKFIIAGCFSGGTDLLVLFILHGLFDLELVFSTSVAFILSFLISFTLQKFWTFRNRGKQRWLHQLGLYIFTAFIGLNLNGAAMHVLVNSLGVWYLLAQLMVNLLLGVVNFIVYKFVIFRKR